MNRASLAERGSRGRTDQRQPMIPPAVVLPGLAFSPTSRFTFHPFSAARAQWHAFATRELQTGRLLVIRRAGSVLRFASAVDATCSQPYLSLAPKQTILILYLTPV
jgi:hypothetical protein